MEEQTQTQTQQTKATRQGASTQNKTRRHYRYARTSSKEGRRNGNRKTHRHIDEQTKKRGMFNCAFDAPCSKTTLFRLCIFRPLITPSNALSHPHALHGVLLSPTSLSASSHHPRRKISIAKQGRLHIILLLT